MEALRKSDLFNSGELDFDEERIHNVPSKW